MEKDLKNFKFNDLIKNGMPGVGTVTPEEAAQIPVLILAYVGDAIYEVYIRTWIVSTQKVPVKMIHKLAVGYVSASAQCESLGKIHPMLTDVEKDIVRRGRNCKTYSSPKNVNINEYRHATAYEVLIGYLYLSNQMDRLNEILGLAIEGLKGE